MRQIEMAALVLFGMFVSSCGTMQFASDDNYRSELNEYIGKPIDVVVSNIGYADSVSQAPNGNKLYVYSSSSISEAPENCRTDATGKERCTGGGLSENWCKTFFEVDESNIIIAASFRGNHCSTCANKDALLCLPSFMF